MKSWTEFENLKFEIMNCSKTFLVFLICIFLFACSPASKKENISTNINANNSIAENVGKTSVNAKNGSSEIVSKISDAELTPSEVFREFDRAIHSRDSEKIKRHITKDSIAFFEEEANEKGMTFKELIEKTSIQKPIENMPEIKSEKIDGDNAIVEAKVTPATDFEKLPFIREDGVWKYAFDKFVKQKMKKSN